MKEYNKSVKMLALVAFCMIIIPSSAYQFSMTNIENFDSLPSLSPEGTTSHTHVYNWLTGEGWSQNFYDTNANVGDTDFSTTGGGLNNADLHYHFGHGDWVNSETCVQYKNWPNSYLTKGEVYKKWGTSYFSANKWVILDACWVLADLQWGGALKHSHGILGFGTYKSVDPELPDLFFEYAIDYDYTISYAWQEATQEVLWGNNQLVRVIFDTEDQLQNDHLPGQGSVSGSEFLDDDTIYYSEWRT